MNGVSLRSMLDAATPPANLTAYNETGIWINDIPGMPAEHLRYPGIVDLLEIPDQVSGTLAIKPRYKQAIIEAKDRCVVRGAWKLVYQPLRGDRLLRLFDTQGDPACTHDLSAEQPQIRDELWRELQSYLARDGIRVPTPPRAATA